MAPELFLGHAPSIASDLYSVGVIAYQLFADELPFSHDSMTQMLQGILGTRSNMTLPGGIAELLAQYTTGPRRLRGQPEGPEAGLRPELDGPLFKVVRRMLARDPGDRYASAQEVLADLSAAAHLPLPTETSSTRESMLQATRLVGREHELTQLTAALRAAKAGKGAALLLGGESGVGKSRLVSEVRTLALVHGVWVAECQSATEGGALYHEWRSLARSLCFRVELTGEEAAILSELVPDVGELLGTAVPAAPRVEPQEMQARLAKTLVALLSRLSKPLLLLFEDLQWARSESLELLKHLLPQLEARSVLVVGTFRIDEKPQLAEQLQPSVLIHLHRLRRTDIANLSTAVLGPVGQRTSLIDYLERQTEGNAFFLIEVLRGLAESAGELGRIGEGELPDTVLTSGIERLLERRLELLPPSYVRVLELLTVAGRQLDLRMLAQAEPELDQRAFLMLCANCAVLEAQGTSWRFSHDKQREFLLRRIPSAERPGLHRQIAAALERAYDPAERSAMSATLAYHHRLAGELEPALRYTMMAGDEAIKVGLYNDARRHFTAAHELLVALPDSPAFRRVQADLLLKQVQSSLITEAPAVHLQRLEEARRIIESLCSTATEPADREDRLRLARIDYLCGRVHYYSGQPSEAIQFYRRVLPVAQELKDEELLILPSYTIGMALCLKGQVAQGYELLLPILEPLAAIGTSYDWLRGRGFQAFCLAGKGEYRAALALLPALRRETRETRQATAIGVIELMTTMDYRLGLDWPAMLSQALDVIAGTRRSGDKVYLYVAYGLAAWAYSYLGQHEQADAHRALGVELATTMGGRLVLSDWFEAADCDIQLNAGRYEAALRRAQEVSAASEASGLTLSHGNAERVCGSALVHLGSELAESERHFARSIEIFASGGLLIEIAHTRMSFGQALRARGEHARAQGQFDLALAQLEASGCEQALSDARRLVQPSETVAA